MSQRDSDRQRRDNDQQFDEIQAMLRGLGQQIALIERMNQNREHELKEINTNLLLVLQRLPAGKIELDTAHATTQSQSIPKKPGP